VIASIRERGCRTVFLSNNPTRDPQMYADKLGGLGIETSFDDIVNPVVTVLHPPTTPDPRRQAADGHGTPIRTRDSLDAGYTG
jgi:Haloacid dehalogenase-like hydrolase